MNYFELFGIPVQLKPKPAQLSGKFFELSKKFHPDYTANEPAAIQAEALEKSALLNKAWKTFQNSDTTIRYVLMEKGLMQEEEKYELPPDFLMEVMDINEQLMDFDASSDKDQLATIISQLSSEIYEPVKEIIENYKDDAVTQEELLQVKEYYYKKKYLDRMSRELSSK